MEFLAELLFTIIFEPIFTLLAEAPLQAVDQSLQGRKIPSWLRVVLCMLALLAVFAVIAAIIAGAVLVSRPQNKTHKILGIVLLSVGLTAFVVYVVVSSVNYAISKRRAAAMFPNVSAVLSKESQAKKESLIGQEVYVVIDRPIGTPHPVYEDISYEVNYGFAPNFTSNDGTFQDVYVLGVDDKPIAEFKGELIAIVHHTDNNEDKWIVAPKGYVAANDEIMQKISFAEQYYNSTLIR